MNGKVGFDYELTKKTIIGGIVSAYKNNFWGDLRNSAAIAIDNKLDTAIDIIASRRDIWKNISTNLNIAHTFSKFRKLSVNLDYIYYTNNNPSDYRYKFIDGRGAFIYEQQAKTNKITPITFWVQSADYSTMLSKKVSMESGIKSTFSILTNNVVFNNSPVYIKQKNLRMTSSLTLKLPKEYVLDISGFYQTRFLFSLIYKAEPLGAVNFGVQKKLKDNKSKVIFNMTDIFKTQIQTYSVNFPQQNVVSWGDLFNSQPLFKFTFTRTFGNDKLKDKRNRTTAEEERARVQ